MVFCVNDSQVQKIQKTKFYEYFGLFFLSLSNNQFPCQLVTFQIIHKIIHKQNLSFEERYQLRAVPWLQSVAAAIQNMLLVATSLGYGSCYNTGCLIAREGIQKVLGIEPPWMLIALVPIGIPAHHPQAPKRKPLETVMEIR